MKLLNLGAGSKRPQSTEWINVDQLRGQMPDDQWQRISGEPNYVEHDISQPTLFPDESFEGVLLAHVVEHFSPHDAVILLRECRRLLKPLGVVMVSVPDSHYFRHVWAQDTGPASWPDLYGVNDPPNTEPSFHTAALFFNQHLQVLSEDSLWCLLSEAGFKTIHRSLKPPLYVNEPCRTMAALLDRIEFSLVMTGTKG